MRTIFASGFVALAVAVPVAGGAATSKSTLRVTGTSPVALRGASFKASERVRVTLLLDGNRFVRTARATRLGTFAVTFTGTSAPDPCSIEAFASGSAGSRAQFKLPERMCPIPLGPQQP